MVGISGAFQEPSRNETLAVGLTPVIVSQARTGAVPRKVMVVRNISTGAASVITINFGNAQAVANAGIVLRQYESFTDATDNGYESYQGTITAICADANGNMAIFER